MIFGTLMQSLNMNDQMIIVAINDDNRLMKIILFRERE